MDLKRHVVDATTEIFQSMLMMDVAPGEAMLPRTQSYQGSISGMVGMAGRIRGMLALHAPESMAKAITGNLLGMPVDSIDEDVKDAIGELANMLAGNIKSALCVYGKEIQLAIPSAVTGQDYTLNCPPNGHGVVVPFLASEGRFLVELQLESDDL